MEEKAVRGVPWTLAGFAVNKLVSVMTTLALTRFIAPEDFGVMFFGLVAVNFLYWFGSISFGATLVVHQEFTLRQQGTVLSMALVAAALAAGGVVAIAPLASSLLNEPRLTDVLVGLSGAVLLGGLISFYDSLLQRELEFRKRFVALAAQTWSFTAIAVTLAVLGGGVWSLVAGQVGSSLVYALVLMAVAPRRVALRWERAVVRTIVRTGRGFFTQGVTVFIRANIDTVVVGRAFGPASVGVYAMAARLGDLTYSALADPIARVTFPAFARSHARQDDVRPAFLSVMRVVALTTVPIGLLLSAASDPFVHVVFGEEWSSMVGPLAVFGLWAAIRPLEATMAWLLNSLGHAGAVGWVAVIVLIPLGVGLFLAVRTDDLRLVACVPLADTILSLCILSALVRRRVRLPAQEVWHAIRPIILWGIPTWLCARAVVEALADEGPILALSASVVMGTLVYALGLWLLDRALFVLMFRQTVRAFGRGSAATADTPNS